MIKKLVQNEDDNETPCLKVLGSLDSLYKVRNVFDVCSQELRMIGMSGLIDWCQNETFNDKELAAFRAGLAVIPEFLMKSVIEVAQIENPEYNNNQDTA